MSISHLLNQSCTVSTKGAVDKFNKPSFGSATTYKCRFQKTSRVIATQTNEREPIDGIVFLEPTAVVDKNDKLIFGALNYKVMRIEPLIDGAGSTRHLELMVQEWRP